MGTLYWQLDDCWPVSSWSSIDYYGRWKALQYFAKRFYSPVLLSVVEGTTQAEIHITNDTTKPVDVMVRWSLERLDGTVVRKDTIEARVGGESDSLLATLGFANDLKDDAVRAIVLVHELFIDGKPAGVGMTSFVPSKYLELPDVKIIVVVKSDADGPYLEVTSDKAARFVYLSIPNKDVMFSDNYFDLPAGRTVRVNVESEIDTTALANIEVHSLRDSY